jgi:hypothetical protein
VGDILGAADYPTIRGLLDSTIGPSELPTARIEQDPYLPFAEVRAKALDPGWEARLDLDDDTALRLRLATACLAAAHLCPVMPAIMAETFVDYRYQRQPRDWVARQQELEAQASGLFSGYLALPDTTGDVPGNFFAFGRATADRGL